ncbi:MAG: glyoxalase/bleomycin resistance/extradiol dioxygenase family protein [Proteobacteria bacterium]|nr:MAG: glyoxalase/bleomycin resistance/extradiol dioxygenase family protein [Pseudomonadota bacterium]
MRIQLALNVRNLDEAVDYYAKLFGAKVNKRKPGYANFALDEPPLKLVLLEVPDAPERLNHLGVEVFEQRDVDAAIERLGAAGIAGEIEVDRTCCYARQNKVWSSDPQGARWEFYRVLTDSESFGEAPKPEPAPVVEARAACGCS